VIVIGVVIVIQHVIVAVHVIVNANVEVIDRSWAAAAGPKGGDARWSGPVRSAPPRAVASSIARSAPIRRDRPRLWTALPPSTT